MFDHAAPGGVEAPTPPRCGDERTRDHPAPQERQPPEARERRMKKIRRVVGWKLDEADRGRLHEKITDRGIDYREIVEIGKELLEWNLSKKS